MKKLLIILILLISVSADTNLKLLHKNQTKNEIIYTSMNMTTKKIIVQIYTRTGDVWVLQKTINTGMSIQILKDLLKE